ncbi:hypothetical protein ACN27F_07735 [Solwaraspora sp. WMMB335]|uniref:hypothetical protein n=1 Tax=Solwaraspora sp. WMMB335 TaxID=3404118 RepID=UPI003B934399
MSLLHAVVCPHPPVIVPEIAGRAAAELDALRAAAAAAVRALLAHPASRIVVIGAADAGQPDTRTAGLATYASFRRWGAPVDVRLGVPGPAGGPVAAQVSALPLSLTVAAWLLAGSGVDLGAREVTTVAVPAALPAAACQRWGQRLAAATTPWVALVMGDGSACRGPTSPGYHDDRAEPFDDAVATALAAADHRRLAALPADLATELRVAGRAPWQVLAGAAAGTGGTFGGDLSYYAAPYGVAYFVASWDRT